MEQQEVVLAGPPGALRGFVPFQNPGTSPVTLREIEIQRPDVDEPVVIPVDELVVGPGQQRRVGIELEVSPDTPPGAHALQVRLGGVAFEATAHVTESRDLVVTPDALVVEHRPVTSAPRTVVVSNIGNVEAHLPDTMTVPVYREDTALTSLRLGLGAAGAAQRLDPVLEPSGELSVTLEGGGDALAAGEVRRLEVQVTRPDDLATDARYLAALPIATRTLLIVVVPGDAAPGKST